MSDIFNLFIIPYIWLAIFKQTPSLTSNQCTTHTNASAAQPIWLTWHIWKPYCYEHKPCTVLWHRMWTWMLIKTFMHEMQKTASDGSIDMYNIQSSHTAIEHTQYTLSVSSCYFCISNFKVSKWKKTYFPTGGYTLLITFDYVLPKLLYIQPVWAMKITYKKVYISLTMVKWQMHSSGLFPSK